jgi:hypothetical protein
MDDVASEANAPNASAAAILFFDSISLEEFNSVWSRREGIVPLPPEMS